MTDERGIFIPQDIVDEALNYDDDGTPLRDTEAPSGGLVLYLFASFAICIVAGVWWLWQK